MDQSNLVRLVAFLMATLTFVGFPFAVAIAVRMVRKPTVPKVPDEVAARLERIEQAVDSIAVEVERISEGQRFTTKLLSERASAEPARLAPPPREPGA